MRRADTIGGEREDGRPASSPPPMHKVLLDEMMKILDHADMPAAGQFRMRARTSVASCSAR